VGRSAAARAALRPHHGREQVFHPPQGSPASLCPCEPASDLPAVAQAPTSTKKQRLTPPSGVGLGVGQRLIDDHLSKAPLTAHLVLLPTTRGATKARATVDALRTYAERAARTSPALRRRLGADHKEQGEAAAAARVHVLSVQLDLCDLPSIYDAAARLVGGTLSNPPLADGRPDPLTGVRVPRLDAAVFNAGIGSWTGLNWLLMMRQFLTQGIVEMCTRPIFRYSKTGVVLSQTPRGSDQVWFLELFSPVILACVQGLLPVPCSLLSL